MKISKAMKIPYSVIIQYDPEFEDYEAWHPEFGRGSCSGCGITTKRALKNLNINRRVLISYLLKKNRPLPSPNYLVD